MALDPLLVEAPPGPVWCREWTAQVDGALRSWLDDHARPGRTHGVAVVALGSYARRELCAGSDIDLLLLHDGLEADDLSSLVQRLCYPLWDIGLAVGHAVRTVPEAVRAATERLDTATALTDRRLVAGDAGLLDGLAGKMRRWLRRRGGQVLSELAAADATRHRDAGPRPGALQPSLKDGAGGLRDLHSLRWAAACVLGEAGLDPLVGARYLGAQDRRDLGGALETLLSARCALHLVERPRPGDVLRLDLQDAVADRLGWGDADATLRRVGLAMRTVSHVHGRTWGRLLADARGGRRRRRPPARPVADGVVLHDGLVEAEQGRRLLADPALGLRAIAAAARHRVPVGRVTAERLRRELSDLETLPWSAEAREALIEILGAGPSAEHALRDADHIGLLDAMLPEWGRVRGHPQRNPWHTYDLDTHLLQSVSALGEIARGRLDEAHAQLWEQLTEPEVVLLATFLHDVGKPWPGDHSEVGERIAQRWVLAMGFEQQVAERVGRLVHHHLLLPDVATRRDLDDHGQIAAVAEAVGDTELLDGLYLLSLADSRATGPAAHSPWKDGLIRELHARVRALLEDDNAPTGPSEHAPAVLAGLPSRYLLVASAAQAAEHARLVMVARQEGGPAASWAAGPAPGTVTLTVVAYDRPGLVADCATALAAHGMAVREARAFTWEPTDGGPPIALDWFDVEPPADAASDPDVVVADLRAALRGAFDGQKALARRASRRGEGPDPMGSDLPVDVIIEDDGPSVRVEVHAPDRPGLLSALARVLADAGLEITGARIATLGPAASDVFFLRSPPEGLEEDAVRERLRQAALASDPVPS